MPPFRRRELMRAVERDAAARRVVGRIDIACFMFTFSFLSRHAGFFFLMA